MKCNDIFDDLVLLSYGELEGDKRLRTETHLRECSECQKAYEKLQSFESCLKMSLDQPLACRDISEDVMSQIPKQRFFPTVAPLWKYATVSLAAACLVIAVSGRINNRAERQTSRQPAIARVKITPSPAKQSPITDKPEQEKETSVSVARQDTPKPRRKRLKRIASTSEPAIRRSAPTKITDSEFELVIATSSDSDTGMVQHKIVASSMGKSVVVSQRISRISSVPPNPDASTMERPPLQTIVRQNKSLIPRIEISSEES